MCWKDLKPRVSAWIASLYYVGEHICVAATDLRKKVFISLVSNYLTCKMHGSKPCSLASKLIDSVQVISSVSHTFMTPATMREKE